MPHIYRATPKPHFAGNFWWARCDHVQNLPEPLGEKGGLFDQLPSSGLGVDQDYLSLLLHDTWLHSNVTGWKDYAPDIDTAAKRCWVCGEMWLHGGTREPYVGIKNMSVQLKCSSPITCSLR